MDAKNEKPSQLGAAHCSKAPRGGVCENGCPSSPGLPRDRKQREGSQASIKQSWLCWIMFVPGNKQDKIAWFKDAYAAERALKKKSYFLSGVPFTPALCSSFTSDAVLWLPMVMDWILQHHLDLTWRCWGPHIPCGVSQVSQKAPYPRCSKVSQSSGTAGWCFIWSILLIKNVRWWPTHQGQSW